MSAVHSHTLKKSKSVNASSSVTDTHTPATGETVYLDCFFAEGPYTTNSVVTLSFDGVLIWSIKGSGSMPRLDDGFVGNGSKVLELKLDNSEASAVILSGMARLRVVTS